MTQWSNTRNALVYWIIKPKKNHVFFLSVLLHLCTLRLDKIITKYLFYFSNLNELFHDIYMYIIDNWMKFPFMKKKKKINFTYNVNFNTKMCYTKQVCKYNIKVIPSFLVEWVRTLFNVKLFAIFWYISLCTGHE